ncbi:MAG TPA: ATP-binding protein, partial [Stellaceae bacterium]|nr:ATP-binding protein [Stellaceae bacterium]
MFAILTKPFETITPADVAELVSESWPEGYTVEFKRALPTAKGGDDQWITGGNKIGDYARDEILSEIVAFANAQGGMLVLGIEETKDKPPRANNVVPLPRVGELARRFEDAARSCIDPPLPRLQVRPIEIQSGEGVVIFRTGPSSSAPHRLTTTLDAYKRHGSSTMKMTMREIQDMTLNVARGLATIDATFEDRRVKFASWGERLNQQWPLAAFRVTALPLEGLPALGRLYGRKDLFP